MTPTSEAMSDVREYLAAKHTPGPWFAKDDDQSPERGAVYVEGPQGWKTQAICDCAYSEEGTERDEANARLIAAAPTLLAELKMLISLAEKEGWKGSMNFALLRAKSAVAKAEAQS